MFYLTHTDQQQHRNNTQIKQGNTHHLILEECFVGKCLVVAYTTYVDIPANQAHP